MVLLVRAGRCCWCRCRQAAEIRICFECFEFVTCVMGKDMERQFPYSFFIDCEQRGGLGSTLMRILQLQTESGPRIFFHFFVLFFMFFLFHIILRSCEIIIFIFFILQLCENVILICLLCFPHAQIILSCSYLFLFCILPSGTCHSALKMNRRKARNGTYYI